MYHSELMEKLEKNDLFLRQFLKIFLFKKIDFFLSFTKI